MRRWGVLALAAGMLSACGGPKQPDWITKGGGAFPKDKNAIYGVGLAENIRSESLLRTTADNRAIAEVAKQLEVLSSSMMRDYAASTADMDEKRETGEQYVENVVKTFTSTTLSGVKVVDRFRDDEGRLYALATISLDELRNMADQMKTLSAEVREHIKARAEQAFTKLSEEEEKRR